MLASALPVLFLASGPDIKWEAPAGCPTEQAVMARLRADLRNAAPAPGLRVHGSVSALEPQGWQLDMVVSSDKFGVARKPPVAAPDCDELADEFVLRVKQSLPERAVRPRVVARVTWRARLDGRGGYGLIRGAPFGGAQLVFALTTRHIGFELGVGGDYGLSKRQSSLDFKLARLTFLLRICREFTAGPVDFHLCAGIEGGALTTHRLQPTTWATTWTDPGGTLNIHAAPALTWWLHPKVGLWLGLSGGPYLARPIPNPAGLPRVPGYAEETRGYGEGALGVEFRWGR